MGKEKPDTGRFGRPPPPLGRRALLRLDRPQPPPRQGLRGNHRFSPRFPLRRFRHPARAPSGTRFMTFETDAEITPNRCRRCIGALIRFAQPLRCIALVQTDEVFRVDGLVLGRGWLAAWLLEGRRPRLACPPRPHPRRPHRASRPPRRFYNPP